jgi:hypothetical protein
LIIIIRKNAALYVKIILATKPNDRAENAGAMVAFGWIGSSISAFYQKNTL